MADLLAARKAVEKAKEDAKEKRVTMTEKRRILDEVVGRRAGLAQQMMHLLSTDEALKRAVPPPEGVTVDVLLEPSEVGSRVLALRALIFVLQTENKSLRTRREPVTTPAWVLSRGIEMAKTENRNRKPKPKHTTETETETETKTKKSQTGV